MRRSSGNNTVLASGELAQVSRRLTEWRRTHKAPTPIPVELWARAAELAAKHGVCRVARVLGLNSATLKERLNSRPAPVDSTAAFIELVAAVPTGIAECAVEVESSRGGRMRVLMKNVTPAGLSSIIRDFVG